MVLDIEGDGVKIVAFGQERCHPVICPEIVKMLLNFVLDVWRDVSAFVEGLEADAFYDL